MVNKQSRSEIRVKKHRRLRHHLVGTAQRPRLSVFRSNNHIYAQIIDDTVGNTLVAASTMEKAIKAAAGKILEKIELFDVYKGSQIAEGKKSVAFNISMRASDRTLTDEEVNGAMSKILKALEELGAQIRS